MSVVKYPQGAIIIYEKLKIKSGDLKVIKKKRIKSRQMDMLQGSIIDKILIFAIPLALGSILQQLFSSIDIAVVGKFASSEGQAAVGGDGPVISMFLNLFIGVSVGVNVVIARHIGEGEKHKVKDTVHTAILSSIFIGIFVLILGMFTSRYILEWMSTPEDVIDQAVVFLRIYLLAVPFIMVYNFGAAVLRSIGDTKRPLLCLVLAGFINTIVNLFLVINFNMGVAGVAIGTVVANIVCSSLVIYFLTHEEGIIRLSLKELRIDMTELIEILKIGLPAGLQSVVFSISNVFIQTSLNQYGAYAVAGSAIALNFEYYIYFVVTSFEQAVVTFTSQNFGAKQYDRCKKIYRITLGLTILVTLVMSLTFVFGRNFFTSLFTSDAETARFASIRMIVLLSLYILICTYEITGGALRGLGYSMTPAVITVFGTCVLRLVWIATVSKWYHSFEILMSVYPISWAFTCVFILGAYFIISRKVFKKNLA